MKKLLSKKVQGQTGSLIAYSCSCSSCTCYKTSPYNNLYVRLMKYNLQSIAIG